MPSNPLDITQIPAPRVDFIDKRTGLMAREWYRFFVNIYNLAGGGNSTASLDDLQVGQVGGASFDSIAEMMKTLQELEIQPPVVPSTGGGTTYSVFTSTTNGLAPASGGGTTNYLRADGTWATPPGTGGVTFANPTALVGSTAVNGVATTAMRSDAAPAIDLTANYTYTGAWTFSRAGTTSALSIYANATAWQCVAGFAGAAEFKMDIAGTATGLGVYVGGTRYLSVTSGNVDVPAGTLTVASTSVRDGGILTSGTVNAARLPTFGTAAAGIVGASGGGTTNYLRADGTWAAPVGTTYSVFTSVANGLAPLSGGGTTNFLRADGTWAAPPGGGGGTPANPTASVGLTAVNGVATTYMRSDAAPALDVSIAPTWSGLHTFSQKVTSTASTSGSATTGAYTYGALGYSDQNNLLTLQSNVNAYNQLVLQNTSALSAASADLTISNNNGTATTFYGNFGMNSSGWAGTAGTATFNAPNVVYVTATSGDLALGTTTSNAIRFVVNSGSDAAIIDTSNRLGIGVGSPTAMLHLKAGTATASTAPLKFNSGTNLTTAEAGAVEYDGSLFYKTPTGTARALSPTQYFYRKNTVTNLNNVTGAQSWLGLTTGVTVAANTIYYFEGEFQLSTTTTTSHTESHLFALTTATVTNIGYSILRTTVSTTATAPQANYAAAATAVTTTGSLTTAQTVVYRICGTVAIGTGGSISPQIQFNTAAPGVGSTVALGAWFRIFPIGATGSNVSIGTWS